VGMDVGFDKEDRRALELGREWYELEGGEELLPGSSPRGDFEENFGKSARAGRASVSSHRGGTSVRPANARSPGVHRGGDGGLGGGAGAPNDPLAQAKRDGVRAGLEVGLRRGYESAMQDFLSAMRDPKKTHPSVLEQAMIRGVHSDSAGSPPGSTRWAAAQAAESASAAAMKEQGGSPSESLFRAMQSPLSSSRLWAALDKEGLGEWAPVLSSRRAQVTVDDLPLLGEEDFEKLGIPLGPRKRLAALAKRMWDESLARDDLLPPGPEARTPSPTPSLAL